MKRFLLTYLLTSAGVFITAMLLPRMAWYGGERPATWDGAWMIGMMMVVMPSLTAWIVLEMTHRIRPRRVFIGHRRDTPGLITLGLLAALITAGLTGVGVGLLEGDVPDGAIVGMAAFIATLLAILPLRRHRKGRCVYCQYDLAGVTVATAGRCPECGAD